MEVMDIERRRALNRERVRRHRAAHAQSKEAAFLPRFNRGTHEHTGTHGPVTESDAHSRENTRVDPLDKGSGSDSSKSENADQPEATMLASNDNRDVEIKNEDEEQQAGAGFDFEEFVSKLKASPTSSVASNASWKSYSRLPISSTVSSHVEAIQSASTSGAQEMTAQNISIPIDSNVWHILFEAIQKLSAEQSQLTAAVNRMGDMLECLTSEVLHRKREPFEKKYNLQIPFANREDFIRFDEQLASDELCRAALTHSLTQKYDAKKSITKNITSILRKYMTREVALLYTAQKAVGGKGLFKDTAFSACLLDTIDTLAEDKIIPPVPDNEYLGNLGAVLSNAKDWGVARHERPRKRQRTDQ